MDALDLLSGDAQTFADKVWAARVHVHHADAASADRLTRLLRLEDVDHLITGTALRAPALRLAQHGTVLPTSRFTRSATLAGSPLTGLVDARKVLDLFDGGATVVLQGLHRYWPPLTDLVRDLELALGHPCQANAYLTPPGSQGFALHSDTHDVFVFQTHGSKRWEVHEGSGPREVPMEPGVSMYLPTGTPHAAHTEQSASLHVTVGVNQLTWRRVLERTVQSVLDDDTEAAHPDDALPVGWTDDAGEAGLGHELATRLRALADRLGAVDPQAVARTEAERFLTSRSTTARGALRDRLALAHLDDHTPLRRRPQVPCRLVVDGERLRVLLGDRELRVPGHLHPAMDHVRAHDEMCAADLAPWLDEESRRVLARRLVVEGLLEVAE